MCFSAQTIYNLFVSHVLSKLHNWENVYVLNEVDIGDGGMVNVDVSKLNSQNDEILLAGVLCNFTRNSMFSYLF